MHCDHTDEEHVEMQMVRQANSFISFIQGGKRAWIIHDQHSRQPWGPGLAVNAVIN